MKNKIFIRNIIDELSFLKDSKNSLKSAHYLEVDNLGILIPLNSHLILNNEINQNIENWETKSFCDSTNNFKKKLTDHLNQQLEICFLIADKSSSFKGLIHLSINQDDKLNLVFERFLFDQNYTKLFKFSIEKIISWAYSVLFIEELYIKISVNNQDLISDLEKINFKKEECFESNKVLKFSNNDIIGKSMILTAGPSIGAREKVFALDAAANGWNNQWSKYLKKFESEFANYIGVKYAMATSSCTGAMHIALMALDIKKGDEVIVPDITWVATANAVVLAGGTPVFADIDLNTWKIDPNSIKKLINKNTKAIMPVHLYGNPCDMDEIMKIALENNLYVVEDAAPSIGAEIVGKKTGSFGDFSAFSFQGAKLAVTGEGGMLCTNDEKLYEKAFRLWDQGRIPGTFWIEELGVKYKMSNIQAAIGSGQIFRNDAMVEAKRRINSWYSERLKDIDCLDFWTEDNNTKSIYWMTNIRLNDKSKIGRDIFCKKLKDFNIDTRPVFPAISQYPYWPKKQDPQPISKIVGDTAINLPSGVALTKNHIDYICDKIINILK